MADVHVDKSLSTCNFTHSHTHTQITDRTEAADAAVQSMEIKGGEPLVVQFAAP